MKKLKNERPTWALFRHVPNNKKGQEFLRMFKLYKNSEVVNHFIRHRKPKPGTSYSHGGHCKPENGTEFSIYVRGNTNWLGNYKKSQSDLKRVRNELHEVEEAFAQCTEDLATMEDIASELQQMSIIQFICYKFKQWRKWMLAFVYFIGCMLLFIYIMGDL